MNAVIISGAQSGFNAEKNGVMPSKKHVLGSAPASISKVIISLVVTGKTRRARVLRKQDP